MSGRNPQKRVYVESSVISYLTARPAKLELDRVRQHITAVWWKRREAWDLFLTRPVLDEIADGDPDAAAKRLECARELPLLPVLPEATALAGLLLKRKLVPANQEVDAMHLALAAAHGAEYLLTWNQKHLDNLTLRARIEALIAGWGFKPALVITPERLLEELS